MYLFWNTNIEKRLIFSKKKLNYVSYLIFFSRFELQILRHFLH